MSSIRAAPCVSVLLNSALETKFCRIPALYARELGSRLCVFEVVFVDEFSDLNSLYVAWNGAESQKIDVYNEYIELPLCVFDGRTGAEALEALQSHTHDAPMAELHLVEGVKRALTIELTPETYEDWESVRANSSVMEDSLLRQMSLVVFGEAFSLRLESGTVINLHVSRLETEDMHRSLKEEEGEEESPTGGMGVFPALLNQNTTVSVVPLRCPVDGDMGISEEESSARKEAQLEELAQKCIDHVHSLFPSRALRCLPASLRNTDTSYLGGKQDTDTHSVRQQAHTGVGINKKESDGADPLDECLDLLSTSPSKATTRDFGKEVEAAGRYDHLANASSDTACRVHPLFLEELIEQALKAIPASFTSLGDEPPLCEAVASRVVDYFRSEVGVVEVKYCPPTRDKSNKKSNSIATTAAGVPQSTRLALVFDSRVRPGSIEIPPCAASVSLSRENNKNKGAPEQKRDGMDDTSTPRLVTLRYLPRLGVACEGEQEGLRGCVAYLRPLEWRSHPNSPSVTGRALFDYDVGKVPHAFYSWLEVQVEMGYAASYRYRRDNCGGQVAKIIVAEGLIVTMQLASKDGHSSADIDFLVSRLETDSAGEKRSDLTFISIDCSDEDCGDSFDQTAMDFAHSVQVASNLQTHSPRPSHLFAAHCLRAPAMLRTLGGRAGAGGDRVLGMEKVVRGALEALLPSMLPSAVLAQLKAGLKFDLEGDSLRYPQALLLTGPEGSGKSHLIRAITHSLATSPRILAASHLLSCKEIDAASVAASPASGQPSEPRRLFTAVIDAFQAATALCDDVSGPCILVLDDLHKLCPLAAAGAESSDGGGDSNTYNERSAIITLLMERLLLTVEQRRQRAREAALAILSGSEDAWAKDTFGANREDKALSVYLSGTIVVLATADDVSNINSRLLHVSCCAGGQGEGGWFASRIAVPSLGRAARMAFLRHSLTFCGCKLTETVPLRLEERLYSSTEGFVARDFMQTAKRIMSSYVACSKKRAIMQQRTGLGVEELNMWTCSAEEVIEACLQHTGEASNASKGVVDAAGRPTWSRVGGLRIAKKEILAVLRSPVMLWKLYRGCPVRLPKGVLLYGPPGCGKTYLAKATALKCGLHMLTVAGPELLGKYIGSSEKAVRDLFAKAHDSGRPTLIFFDEFEALAPRRGTDNTGVTDRVVNQLLTFLDGVEDQPGSKKRRAIGKGATIEEDEEEEELHHQVFIMAATSRPDLIDKALLRPGRVEKHLYCGKPSEIERRDILSRSLRAFPCEANSSQSTAAGAGEKESDEGKGETVEQAVEWVCKQDKALACVSADLSALANSAFLEATQEVVGTPSSGEVERVLIRARHLRMAFEALRPSLSAKDLCFYQRIHDAFGGEPAPDATASSRPPVSPVKSGSAGGVGDDNYYGMLGYVPVYSSSPLRKPYGATGHVSGYPEDRPTAASGEDQLSAIRDAGQTFNASEAQRTTLM